MRLDLLKSEAEISENMTEVAIPPSPPHKSSPRGNSQPFKCEYCGKEFGRRQHYTVHRRIHTGERPYSCNFCSMRFNQIGPLIKHKQRQHGIMHKSPKDVPLSRLNIDANLEDSPVSSVQKKPRRKRKGSPQSLSLAIKYPHKELIATIATTIQEQLAETGTTEGSTVSSSPPQSEMESVYSAGVYITDAPKDDSPQSGEEADQHDDINANRDSIEGEMALTIKEENVKHEDNEEELLNHVYDFSRSGAASPASSHTSYASSIEGLTDTGCDIPEDLSMKGHRQRNDSGSSGFHESKDCLDQSGIAPCTSDSERAITPESVHDSETTNLTKESTPKPRLTENEKIKRLFEEIKAQNCKSQEQIIELHNLHQQQLRQQWQQQQQQLHGLQQQLQQLHLQQQLHERLGQQQNLLHKQQLKAKENQIEALQQTVDQLRKAHADILTQQQQHQSQLAELQHFYHDQISQLKSNHQRQIQSLHDQNRALMDKCI
ncbi:unnamed protein product [Owenia fusiformis]|uniref:Uncharacterized protein n=1 Tax=Owenia fusiformis TaxID=6347 RepID=A0A8J1U7A0_OWEFU|nr:unnamed protein product [Owenia fusiformis]